MPASEALRRYTRAGLPIGVETRAGKDVIYGYAAVFYDPSDAGTEYRIWDDLVERIMPGAFDRAIREDDVRALFNHNDSAILGRVKAGTMRLSVDKRGLKYEIDPPDTQCARDLLQSLRRGDIDGSSFMFKPKATAWERVDGIDYIVRKEVYLYDVGPVAFPAYTATESGVRSVADAEAIRDELESLKGDGRRNMIAQAKARAVSVAAQMA